MKLAFMQPYFFPYAGYFNLINQSDIFVFFDTVIYKKKSWMSRNLIMHEDKIKTKYINMPVSSESKYLKDVEIINYKENFNKLIKSILHYKKTSKYFPEVIEILNQISNEFNDNDKLSQFNIIAIKKISNYLNINTEFKVFSDMKIVFDNIRNPGDWAYELAKYLNCCEYLNLPSGESIFDKDEFNNAGIKLNFLDILNDKKSLATNEGNFLSILDVMLRFSNVEIKQYLDSKVVHL